MDCMRIKTSQSPIQCYKCSSKSIGLYDKHFKKDANGKETDVPYLGIWMCDECGEVIGRMIGEDYSEVHPDSL